MFCHKQLWHSFIFHFIPTGALKKCFSGQPRKNAAARAIATHEIRNPKKNNNIKLNWESGLHFSFMLLPIRVCVCVCFYFSMRFLYDSFLVRSFQFSCIKFRVFFCSLQRKRKKMNENPKPFTKCYIIEIVNIEMSIGFRARA